MKNVIRQMFTELFINKTDRKKDPINIRIDGKLIFTNTCVSSKSK